MGITKSFTRSKRTKYRSEEFGTGKRYVGDRICFRDIHRSYLPLFVKFGSLDLNRRVLGQFRADSKQSRGKTTDRVGKS